MRLLNEKKKHKIAQRITNRRVSTYESTLQIIHTTF